MCCDEVWWCVVMRCGVCCDEVWWCVVMRCGGVL